MILDKYHAVVVHYYSTALIQFPKERAMNSGIKGGIPVVLLPVCLIAASPSDVIVEKKVNYNSWGAAWDSVVVVKNNIITLAAAPKLGGRVMQYDLGSHPSIFVNQAMINKTITDGDTMVGGFRQLPSPQSDFGWPPPPTLDFGKYLCTVKTATADSCVIYLESPIETSTDSIYAKHKGLQYKRTVTLYKASSRVKVEMVMLNKGTVTLTHGIWDITQSDCSNSGAADKQNMWVYFPLNPQSTLGHGKQYVEYQGTNATQWNKNIVPGIMGVQYRQVVAKIGADCKAGWVCFVDRLDGYAYAKTFTYQDGKQYPDSGASVQVYTYSRFNNTEVEVLGPLTALRAGDSVGMVENWYAARSKGPIYSVNSAGLISKPIDTVQTRHDTIVVQGSYGVFYPGTVRAMFKKADGGEFAAADSYSVTPNEYFELKDTLKVPAGAAKMALGLYTIGGKFVGNLDSITVKSFATKTMNQGAAPFQFRGNGLIITPKKKGLSIHMLYEGAYHLEIATSDGRRILELRGRGSSSYLIPRLKLQSGVIYVRAFYRGAAENRRVIVLSDV
jgi:hypothetical protein